MPQVNRLVASSKTPQAQNTNTVTSGPLSPKAPFTRSAKVGRALAKLARESQDGFASSTIIHAANARLQKYEFDHGTGKAKEANLIKPPVDGHLRMTVCLNVSGHDGRAEVYAKDPNQAFEVKVTGPDGKSQLMKVPTASRAPGVPLYAVAQDIELSVSAPGTYLVEAWPSGSLGVGGYVEGRRYRLHVGEKNFFKPGPDACPEP